MDARKEPRRSGKKPSGSSRKMETISSDLARRLAPTLAGIAAQSRPSSPSCWRPSCRACTLARVETVSPQPADEPVGPRLAEAV